MKTLISSGIDRLLIFGKLKLILNAIGIIVITIPYFIAQHFPFTDPYWMKETLVDRWVPFNDNYLHVYNSIHLLTIGMTLQFKHLRPLLRYAGGVIFISLVSCLIFYFLPTACPRPSIEGTSEVYQLFVSIEKPLNAFPSMHISLSLFALISALNYEGISSRIKIALVVWVAFISYSTLATKQHVALDVYGGVFMAVVMHVVNNRYLATTYERLANKLGNHYT